MEEKNEEQIRTKEKEKECYGRKEKEKEYSTFNVSMGVEECRTLSNVFLEDSFFFFFIVFVVVKFCFS